MNSLTAQEAIRPTPSRPSRPSSRRRRRPPRSVSVKAACATGRRASTPAPEPEAPEPAPTPAPNTNFDAEVLQHRSSLYAAALRLTKQANDAEDLVQETMLRAFTAWDRFEKGSNCRAWLFRILTNSFINNYRRRRRHRRFATERPDDAVAALYGNSHREAHDPEEVLLHDALSDEVNAALASLGDDYRRVVELADLQGIRYRDIADQLGVPIGTVMSRLFRARRQLEAQLEEYAASDYGIVRAA